MSAIRFLGVIAALTFLLFAVRGYGRRRVSRLSLIMAAVLTLAVIAIAIWPNLFDPIFSTFRIEKGNDRQLVFILLVAVVVLFFLVLRAQSYSDTNERSIRLLVEALGQERFDWSRAAALPLRSRPAVTIHPRA